MSLLGWMSKTAAVATTDRYLEGDYAPVREEVTAFDLPVTGMIPDVVILNARDFTGEPQATIHLPQRVPFGFHGNWVPSA
jgi:carotenoid cleavage dioxygenase-like enzyme